MRWLRKLFNKQEKQTLRDKLVEIYGEAAGICYDEICQGIPIGGFLETAAFVMMIEEARKSLEKN